MSISESFCYYYQVENLDIAFVFWLLIEQPYWKKAPAKGVSFRPTFHWSLSKFGMNSITLNIDTLIVKYFRITLRSECTVTYFDPN